jgi:hypothetical protein
MWTNVYSLAGQGNNFKKQARMHQLMQMLGHVPDFEKPTVPRDM